MTSTVPLFVGWQLVTWLEAVSWPKRSAKPAQKYAKRAEKSVPSILQVIVRSALRLAVNARKNVAAWLHNLNKASAVEFATL